ARPFRRYRKTRCRCPAGRGRRPCAPGPPRRSRCSLQAARRRGEQRGGRSCPARPAVRRSPAPATAGASNSLRHPPTEMSTFPPAPAAPLQRRTQRRGDEATQERSGHLKAELILELYPVALGGEDRADEPAARVL